MTRFLLPLTLFVLPLLQVAERWFFARDVDIDEGMYMPDRWIAWGTVRALNRRARDDHRYFFVRLPVLEHEVGYRGEMLRLQLVIAYRDYRWGFERWGRDT